MFEIKIFVFKRGDWERRIKRGRWYSELRGCKAKSSSKQRPPEASSPLGSLPPEASSPLGSLPPEASSPLGSLPPEASFPQGSLAKKKKTNQGGWFYFTLVHDTPWLFPSNRPTISGSLQSCKKMLTIEMGFPAYPAMPRTVCSEVLKRIV